MANLEPIPYSDAKIRSILERVRTIDMVGASPNWNRPSYFIMKYLQGVRHHHPAAFQDGGASPANFAAFHAFALYD
jgi:hypothetical protein